MGLFDFSIAKEFIKGVYICYLMVLDKLSTSLKATLKKIAKAVFVDEHLIEELVKDIQKALLYADVNVQLVFDLTKNIKQRALKEKAPAGISQREYLIKIVYEELVKFLGEEKKEIKISGKPFKIMLVGLYGSGKTTTSAKLAKFYQKRGFKVGMVQLDVWRPAAAEQLLQLGKQIDVDVFVDKDEKDPIKIYNKFKGKYPNYDLLIVDTAGRDALSDELVEEIEKVSSLVDADEKLLVISADIGQAAEKQALQFHKSCGITGVIATKMDGTAKAGGALTACAVSGASIKFIGVGEKVDDLEEFNPKGFVGRLLGMGDLEALLEKAKEAISEEEAADLGKKFLKGDFNFLDLYEQMKAMGKMGPLTKVLDMIPGVDGLGMSKDMVQEQEAKLKKWKFIMQSMTKEELENPDVLNGQRIERIAKGSGCAVKEIRELIKQYNQSKKFLKMMKGKQDPKSLSKIMKKFKGKMPKF